MNIFYRVIAFLMSVYVVLGCASAQHVSAPQETTLPVPDVASNAEFLEEVTRLTEQPPPWRGEYASAVPEIIDDLKNARSIPDDSGRSMTGHDYPEYVRWYAAWLESNGYDDPVASTIGSPEHWRAVIALPARDITAMLVRLLLLMDAGELARAEIMLLFCVYDQNPDWDRDARILRWVYGGISSARGEASALIEEGNGLWDRGLREEALKRYRAALERYPKSPWGLWELGNDRLLTVPEFLLSPEYNELYAYIRRLDPHYELAWYQGEISERKREQAQTLSKFILPSYRRLWSGEGSIEDFRALADGYTVIGEPELAFYAYKYELFHTFSGSFDTAVVEGACNALRAMGMGPVVEYFNQFLADVERSYR